MDKFVMDIRLKQWIPILEAQARSGLDKQSFCKQNGISRGLFFKWQRILRERIAEGFDPTSVLSPAITDDGSADGSNEFPVFFEITPTSSCGLAETDKCSKSTLPQPAVSATDSFRVSISYDDFSISLSGEVDESALAAILRAVKHA